MKLLLYWIALTTFPQRFTHERDVRRGHIGRDSKGISLGPTGQLRFRTIVDLGCDLDIRAMIAT